MMIPLLGWGHTHHPHPSKKVQEKEGTKVDRSIQEYKETVAPIIEAKCLHCHGGQIPMPWYHRLPGIKQLINHHRRESEEHLDMSKGFPFGGHGTQQENFEAMREIAEVGSMPPWYYRVMHQGSALTQREREVIKKWADSGLLEISKKGKEQ